MSADVETGVRGRTRRAILSAAASALARDRAATLATVAEAAGVGRTTLHRYFSDREELVAAVVQDSWCAIGTAIKGAAVDQDSPVEAMKRLVAGMVDVGDRLLFLFGDPAALDGMERPKNQADPVLELIKRGQAAGVFDTQVDAIWIRNVLWGMVYTGCEAANEGRLPRHGVATTVTRTLLNGIV